MLPSLPRDLLDANTKIIGSPDENRGNAQGDQSQLPINPKHNRTNTYKSGHTPTGENTIPFNEFLGIISIGGDAFDNFAGFGSKEVGHRQVEYVRKKVETQFLDNCLGEFGQNNVVQIKTNTIYKRNGNENCHHDKQQVLG